MESNKDANSYISFTEIKYENLSFLGKKAQRSIINEREKTPNKGSSLNNIALITKELIEQSKSQDKKTRRIDLKWRLVNRSFEMILKFVEKKKEKKNEAVLIKKINILRKRIRQSVKVKKEEIYMNTAIDEEITLDIFLLEIKSFFNKAIKSKINILKTFRSIGPFLRGLRALYRNKASELRTLIAPLFKVENNTENNELLKILKIDYFQKCINDKAFSSKCMLKILNLKETDLYTLDLNLICLPFIENKRLMTWAKFITKIFESESFLQAMLITMNFQSKEIVYSKKEIKESMTEIYKYLLYPVVFPNNEDSKLYAVTCINLKLYLSSFVIENIDQNLVDSEFPSGHKKCNEKKKICALKEKMFDDLCTGFEFAVLIITIIHESFHILRRHLIEPKVYINTDDIDKESLNQKIDETSEEKISKIIFLSL